MLLETVTQSVFLTDDVSILHFIPRKYYIRTVFGDSREINVFEDIEKR